MSQLIFAADPKTAAGMVASWVSCGMPFPIPFAAMKAA
jgi:hypothetical protein